MPKKIDYPRASLSRVLDLAHGINSLGGQATLESAAEKIGMKVSGSFHTLVGTAAKYGLVEPLGKDSSGRRILATTDIYRRLKLAYTEDEQGEIMQQAALNPPVFKAIQERFVGGELPRQYLDRLLVREYGVAETEASRVRGYLLEAFSMAGLIDDKYRVAVPASETENTERDAQAEKEKEVETPESLQRRRAPGGGQEGQVSSDLDHYRVTVVGPDLNTTVIVQDPEDFDMVDVTISRMRRRLQKRLGIAGGQSVVEPAEEAEESDDDAEIN